MWQRVEGAQDGPTQPELVVPRRAARLAARPDRFRCRLAAGLLAASLVGLALGRFLGHLIATA